MADARAVARPARTVAGATWRTGTTTGRGRPLVTTGLIAVNVVVFLIALVQAGGESRLGSSQFITRGGLVPMQVAAGEWWSLVTSGFLHLSMLHIAMNMFSLYMIGVNLERVLGPLRFGAVYALSLLGGSVAVYLLSDVDVLTAGASGAIFGLLGALGVTFKRMRLDLRQLGILLAINLAITFLAPGISWQAHVGGLIVGAIVGAAMVYAPAARRAQWQWGTCVLVLVVLVSLVVLRNSTIGDWTCVANGCYQS